MGRALWLRIAAIVAVALALLIPLGLIESKITEREATRAAVVQELAHSSVGEQVVSGPLLIVPCTEHYFAQTRDANGRIVREARTRDCTRAIVAETLEVTGSVTTENRYRGIYSARFFVAKLAFAARFAPAAAPEPEAGARREWGTPRIAMAVRDTRGIRSVSELAWNGAARPFEPASGSASGMPIVQALAAQAGPAAGAQSVGFTMELAGLQRLQFVPSARNHQVALSADWPHPSFVGRHLPLKREVNRDGTSALWRVSELASAGVRALAACGDPACNALEPHTFGLALLDPVDVYVQANRAVKYALLFVLLTFAAFFLFEILRDLRLHPVQYALVGLALAVFFLLLIALSEHIPFIYAYFVAASACVTLIATYLHAALGGIRRGVGFGAMLAALYTMLYALLRSEDHSLLLGSLLVFAVLAAVMLLTRRIDWYRVGA